MFNAEQLQIIRDLQYLSRCPIQVFNGEEPVSLPLSSLTDIPVRIESPLISDPSLLGQFLAHRETEPMIIHEGTAIHYGFWRQDEEMIFIIGPVASKEIERDAVRSYMKAHQIRDAKNFFIASGTEERTMTVLSLIRHTITGEYHPAQYQPKHTANSEKQIERSALSRHLYSMTNEEEGEQHIPYQYEEQIRDMIRHGDLNALRGLSYRKVDNYSLGKVAFSPLKEAEYQAVLQEGLMQRAAVEGGVNPYEAYDMGDMFLQKISICKSVQEIRQVQIECMITFCTAVKKAKEAHNPSPYIQKCKNYVDRHLNQPLRTDDIATYLGLSPQYLSELFHKETGQTLKDYIQEERIGIAKDLLKYSDCPISEIASYLAFSSQSHFGTVFRKYEGMSPTEYRKKIHATGDRSLSELASALST